MKTKISMKTIYLILVITIGLVGLGIGSTLAGFYASGGNSKKIQKFIIQYRFHLIYLIMVIFLILLR